MNQPRDVKGEIVRQWVSKAELDFKAARSLFFQDEPLFYPSCFHAQQAVEKYFKAYLTWKQIEFSKTHDLAELLDLIEKEDAALARMLSDAPKLTPFGVEVRYPGDIPEPTARETREAVEIAEKIRSTILSILGSTFRALMDEK